MGIALDRGVMRVAAIVGGVCVAAACASPRMPLDGGDSSPSDTTPDVRVCPATWVRLAVGGCAPAVLACVVGGRAAPGVCDGIDVTVRPASNSDAGEGGAPGFYVLADGGIGGPWHEPGDPDGPPAADWFPDAAAPSCPTGWRTAGSRCDPRLRFDCPAGSLPLAGNVCTPTAASDCPATDWADVARERGADPETHVRSGADPASADGSEARPFATITAALASLARGGWILVAPGTYNESLNPGVSVHIVGACAARVALTVSPPGAIVQARGAGARVDIRGVRLFGGAPAIDVSGGGSVEVARASIEGSIGAAIHVTGVGSRLAVVSAAIRGSRDASGTGPGDGVVIEDGATANVLTTAFADVTGAAVRASGAGTRLALSSVVTGAFCRGSCMSTGGVVAAGGAEIAVVASSLSHGGSCATVAGAGSVVSVDSSAVASVRPSAGPVPAALVARDGGRLRASSIYTPALSVTLADAAGRGTTAALDHVAASGTSATILTVASGAVMTVDDATLWFGAGGAGDATGTASELRLRRCRVSDQSNPSSAAALRASDAALLDLDLVVVETGAAALRLAGATARVAHSRVSQADAARTSLATSGVRVRGELHLSAVRLAGLPLALLVEGDGSTAIVADSIVTAPAVDDDNVAGRAVVVRDGATVQLARTTLDAAGEVALDVGVRASAIVDGSAILAPSAVTRAQLGWCVAATTGATLRMSGSLLADCSEFALAAAAGARGVDLRDVIVGPVNPAMRGFGWGIAIGADVPAELYRVAIHDVRGAALATAGSSDMSGSSGAMFAASDVFVRDVERGGVTLEPTMGVPASTEFAIGVLIGGGGSVRIDRGTIVNTTFGYVLRSGDFVLRDSTIAGALASAGGIGVGVDPSRVLVERTELVHNARSLVVDVELPEPRVPNLPAWPP